MDSFNDNTDSWLELKTVKPIYSFAVCQNYIIVVLEDKNAYYCQNEWSVDGIKNMQWKYMPSLGDKFSVNGNFN